MGSLEECVQCLITEVFPWGKAGFPQRPDTEDRRRQTVELWLKRGILPFRNLALALAARIYMVLREREAAAHNREGIRLFARIDTSALTKTPESVLEKLARRWEKDGTPAPPVDFHNFQDELTDLGRFRIIANFLSDAEEIATTLEAPFQPGPAGELTAAQEALAREFVLKSNRLERSFHFVGGESRDHSRIDPHGGARSGKGVFHRRGQSGPKIEVQIQTQLQEAWDKKEHSLVYEPERRQEWVNDRHRSEMIAMSHLLYIADCSFDRLRQEMLTARGGK